MGKKMPAISVIIPMYNEEKYIVFCMESLLNQTFQDYEVLLLDDASTDGTYGLCQKLYGSLPKVGLIKGQGNVGRGAIRNKGIDIARGKYIYFLDADDELLPEALEKFYAKAEEMKADVVHTSHYMKVFSDEKMLPRRSLWKHCRCGDTREGLLEGGKEERMMYQGQGSQPMPWLNLYKREFLMESGIRFPDLPYGEDNIFSVEVAMRAGRFVRFNEYLNLYRLSFAKKEREKKRLDSALGVIPRFLRQWSRIFDVYGEEELPFDAKLTFMKSWLRAHLRYTVYDVVNTSDREVFKSLQEYLQPVMPGGALLGALLVNMIEVDTWERKMIHDQAAEKRQAFQNLFAELEKGDSAHQLDFAYIYSEARQAQQIGWGEESFYCRASLWRARACLVLGRREEMQSAYEEALAHAAEDADMSAGIVAEKLAALSYADTSGKEMRGEYERLRKLLGEIVPYDQYRQYSRSKGRKIRLGVLASSFCRHELFGVNFGLLFCYDKENFDLFCYSLGRQEDDFTLAIRSQVEGFASLVGLGSQEAAEKIHGDGVDVLLDLTDYGMARALPMLAYRPAPLQIGGPGHLLLSDSKLYDYFLTDAAISPGGGRHWLLPCACSYAMRDDVVPCSRAPVTVNGYITFGVTAKYSQLTDDMLSLWQEILEKVPGSRLILRMEEFTEKAMLAELEERLHFLGLDRERIQPEGTMGDSLPRLLDMDILLCPYPSLPYGRLLDALYMGVPPVSLYGSREDTRRGFSILSQLGLEELATDSREKYVAKAMALAADRDLLDSLHRNMRTMLEKARELNPAVFVRALERKIRERGYGKGGGLNA